MTHSHLLLADTFQGSQTDLKQIGDVQQLHRRVEELEQEMQIKEERAVLEAVVHKESRDKQVKLIENLQSKVWSFQK